LDALGGDAGDDASGVVSEEPSDGRREDEAPAVLRAFEAPGFLVVAEAKLARGRGVGVGKYEHSPVIAVEESDRANERAFPPNFFEQTLRDVLKEHATYGPRDVGVAAERIDADGAWLKASAARSAPNRNSRSAFSLVRRETLRAKKKAIVAAGAAAASTSVKTKRDRKLRMA